MGQTWRATDWEVDRSLHLLMPCLIWSGTVGMDYDKFCQAATTSLLVLDQCSYQPSRFYRSRLNMGLEAWTTFFSTYFYLILGVITIINVNVWTYWWVRYCSVSGIENTLKGYFTQNMKILSLCRFKPVLLVFSSVAQKDNVFPCSYKQCVIFEAWIL